MGFQFPIKRLIGAAMCGFVWWLTGVLTQNYVFDEPKKIMLSLVGSPTGSMYSVCDQGDAALERFASANLAEKQPTDIDYNFYSIENAKEYLDGDDAVVVEKGPYSLRKHSIKYNMEFKTSTLTNASTPESNGALHYDVANAYIVLDKDTAATSNVERGADMSLSFSDGKVTLPTATKKMPAHLSMSDEVINFSPAYLSLLGEKNDEVSMVLSLSCTKKQIENIPLADPSGGKAQCSASEMNDASSPDCACCMLDNDYVAISAKQTGTPPPYTNCKDLLDENSDGMKMLSLLASYDGGVEVKDSFHSALIQSHSVNDIMFGYPSAFLGKVVPFTYMDVAQEEQTNVDKVDVAKQVLTGQMKDSLPFELGDIAKYTKNVGSVCSSTCSGGACSGNAPGRHETADADKIVLGGINCKPYTATHKTVEQCSAISTALTADPNDADHEACVCADGSNDFADVGCCLAAGMLDGTDLTGSGCLYPVAGVVDPNYVGKDADVGKAIESWVSKEESKKSAEFMCPAPGLFLDEHKLFGSMEAYEGKDKHTIYYKTGNPRIRQGDILQEDAEAYHAPANVGHGGMYINAKGLSAPGFTSLVSDGDLEDPRVPFYMRDMKKDLIFNQENYLSINRTKICGTERCIMTARMKPLNTSFHYNVNTSSTGVGLPYDGLQPIGHASGPTQNGRPVYFHQPLYFNGDEELLSQQNNSHLEATNGNGIKIYRSKTSADPGAFSVGGANGNYELVDKDWMAANGEEKLQSQLDIEGATGVVTSSHMRFGMSYSIWECDPETNDHCRLATMAQGEGLCYGEVGTSIFTALNQTEKDDLTAVGRNQFTYPCSAANLMTPKVTAGKIMPMYWSDESKEGITTEEIDVLVDFGKDYYSLAETVFWLSLPLFLFFYIGVCMFHSCILFESDGFKHKSGPVDAPKE